MPVLPIAAAATNDAVASEADSPDADTARALVQRLAGQRSTAEMLQELRQAFPDMPLAARVAALSAIRFR